MPALVLRQGRISEELAGEAGVYPRLRLLAGRLMAGISGADLQIIAGRITQMPSSVPWDEPTWDAAWSVGWDDALCGVTWS